MLIDNIYKVNGILKIDYKCRNYCKIPYYNHPNGCPNFNKNPQCPPKVKLVENVFNLNKDLYFVVEQFDLQKHINIMRHNHPDWSHNQLKNLLYWQNGVRKRLKVKTEEFISNKDKDMIYTLLPEAMGVMVIETVKKLGIPIEEHPEHKIYKIALVGYKLSEPETQNEIDLFL